jgi:hypothetical protein
MKCSALLEEVDLEKCSPSEMKEMCTKAEQRLAAVVFLCGSNMRKYGQVLEHLHNGFIQGNNLYPADVGAAYRLLSHWQQADHMLTHGVPGDSGIAFATIGGIEFSEDKFDGTGFQF